MHTGFDALLWEDLDEIQAYTHKALEALATMEHAIKEGHIGQPTRQDSKRLNRLVALTDLVQIEITRWVDELGLSAPLPSSNGRTPAAQ